MPNSYFDMQWNHRPSLNSELSLYLVVVALLSARVRARVRAGVRLRVRARTRDRVTFTFLLRNHADRQSLPACPHHLINQKCCCFRCIECFRRSHEEGDGIGMESGVWG